MRFVLTILVSKRCYEKAAFYGKTVSNDMPRNCQTLLLRRSYKATKNAMNAFMRVLHNEEDLTVYVSIPRILVLKGQSLLSSDRTILNMSKLVLSTKH